jgi:hypothetical protein
LAAAITAATSSSSGPPLVPVVSAAELVVGVDSEVIGAVVGGAVVPIEVAVVAGPGVVGSSGALDTDGKGLGAPPADVVAAKVAGALDVPAVTSPESRVSRMIAVVAPPTTSTARIASSTLRVVLLRGGSGSGGPYPGVGPYGGPPGGNWVGGFCAGSCAVGGYCSGGTGAGWYGPAGVDP